MELYAPSQWVCIDLISDLHLQATEPETFVAWTDYLRRTKADAVLMLGDVFEVWVGDDAAMVPLSFEAQCMAIIKEASKHFAVYFMHGNRDFLLGQAFACGSGATLLPDPTVLNFAGERIVLTHGDALCVDDIDYQRFRQQVRSSQWQSDFLAKPLAERQSIARSLRQQSEAAKARNQPKPSYADVEPAAVLALLQTHEAGRLIHGHTHLPADHALGSGHMRHVLTDWDVAATPSRAEVLRLSRLPNNSMHAQRLPFLGPL